MDSENTFVEDEKKYHFLNTTTERIVFLIALTLVSVAPIIFGKSIPSHADWHIHMEHAYNFKRIFFEGTLFPRWIDAQVNGYGLPIFNFYAPLVYYLFTLLEVFFRDPILSIKWTFVIPMILCTIFGYLYLRRHGSPIASASIMPFIIFSPAIHIFIYNTNWPTSTLALAFLFLTLYGIDSFDKTKDLDFKFLLLTSVGYGGMILAHIATAFVFTLLAIPYFFLSLNIYRTKKFLKNYVLGLGLGAGLGAFYLLPAIFERRLVHTQEVLTQGPLWDYSKNFLFTVLDRDKDDGFAWAIFDHRYYEMSNAVFGIAVLICLIVLLTNIDKVKSCFSEPFRITSAIIMFTFCFLMMTPLSYFVWLMIKPLQTIQFPWRFTAFALPFGTVIMVYALDLISVFVKEKINMAGHRVIVYALLILFSTLGYLNFLNMFNWRWVPEESLLKSAINVLWGNEEYRPNLIGDPDWKQINFRQDFSPSVKSSNQNAEITFKKWISQERVFDIFSPLPHQVRLRTLYFPGWNAYIDGKKENIQLDPKLGAMIVEIPAGLHEIKFKFENTSIRKTSAYVSLIALVLYLYFLSEYFGKRKSRKGEIA